MNIKMTLADILKWAAWGPVTLGELHGMNNQAGNLYIQFHEVPPKADGTLAAGAVPNVKSLQVLAGQPFAFTNLVGVTLSECLIAISSTEVNYTAVGANGGLDMTVVVVSDFLCDGTEVVVGDLTTAVNTLQVWSEAAGLAAPKKLLRVSAVDTSTNVTGVAIQTTDALQTVVPPSQLLALPASTTKHYQFGYDGISPFTQTAAYSGKRGCTLRVVKCTTPPYYDSPLAQPAVAATAIRAIYKS